MSNDIYLCFTCGARNRVPPTALRASAKCGTCGELLFPGEVAAKPASQSKSDAKTTERPLPQATPHPPSSKTSGKTPVVLLCVVGLGVIWSLSQLGGGNNQNLTSPRLNTSAPTAAIAIDGPVPAAAPLPPPVLQQAGLMWNRTGRRPEAPLEILTSSGADYYVKLVDFATNQDAVAIYINGGSRIEVQVPLGSYRIRYASGTTWRGEATRFGPAELTSYNEAQERFDFTDSGGYINGYTVELIMQVNGNLATRNINDDQF